MCVGIFPILAGMSKVVHHRHHRVLVFSSLRMCFSAVFGRQIGTKSFECFDNQASSLGVTVYSKQSTDENGF